MATRHQTGTLIHLVKILISPVITWRTWTISKNVAHENHTTLKALTRNLDELQNRVENAEGQPMETIHNLECKLHRLSLTFQPSAPP